MEVIMAENKQKQEQDLGNVPGGTGFPEAPADGNVFPPGAPQTSHGSATGPIHTPRQDPAGNRQQAPGGVGDTFDSEGPTGGDNKDRP
jgi:hypothetical protein